MLALLSLTALLQAATSPAWPPVHVAAGGGEVPVRVAVEVLTHTSPAAAPVPVAWATDPSGALVGNASGPGWLARVELAPDEGGARALDVALRWTGPALLRRAAVRLEWPGRARALTTDLTFGPLERARRVGRGTPLLAEAGGLVLTGGEGFEAARYDPGEGRSVEVTLYLDDARDRPFSTYGACLDHLPAPEVPGGPVRYAALERRTKVLEVARAAGDVDRGRAVLHPAAEGAPFLPLVPERWARGARAAVVFTDHADRSDAPALRALLWGSSEPQAEGRPGAGFLGRGLRITKSFFVSGPPGSLADPAIAPLAADLVAAGSEVALHSITPGRDDRAAVARGLVAAAPWAPATWIDHEPYTNCEAIATAGWRASGPFGVRDLLAHAGVRWVWSAGDVGGFAPAHGGPPAALIDLFGDGDGPPPIYPLPADPRLWAFESTFFYAAPGELAAALSDAALASLEGRRGLFVGHTYLGAGLARTHQPGHLARLAVRRAAGGALVVDPALDAALGRIAARAGAGTLASLTWSQAGDRLRALGDVQVRYLPDGAAAVTNAGDVPIDGLTLSIPEEGLELTAGGVALPHADAPGATRVFLDLAPGERAVLHAWRGLEPVAFLVPP